MEPVARQLSQHPLTFAVEEMGPKPTLEFIAEQTSTW